LSYSLIPLNKKGPLCSKRYLNLHREPTTEIGFGHALLLELIYEIFSESVTVIFSCSFVNVIIVDIY